MSVGVIGHLVNPTAADVAALARAAEAAAADWLGLADAFWWRDVWMLLADAARATDRIELGPAMTNPYLRHPFHTVSALATLAELARPAQRADLAQPAPPTDPAEPAQPAELAQPSGSPSRVFLGLAAGGSEVSGAAGVPRRDAPERVAALIDLVRRVAAGEPLDPISGRRLDLALPPVPVMVAARGDRLLRTAGRLADRVLLWAVPDSDLERTVALARNGAAERGGPQAELVWAPLVDHGPDVAAHLDVLACYGVMNAGPVVRRRWELDEAEVAWVRSALVAGDPAAARQRVPERVLDDLVYRDADPARLAARARPLGITGLAVPAFRIDTVAERVAWARTVEAGLH